MAWIIGQVSDQEIENIKQAGYEIDEVLSIERTKQIFNCEELEDIEEDKMIMFFIDCEVTDLLSMHEEDN